MPLVRNFKRVGREIHFGIPVAKMGGVIAGTGTKTTTDTLDQPFDDDMLRLTQFQNNFFRHWILAYWNYSPVSSIQQRNCAFLRQNGKWDLRAYNADYFTRLVNMIGAAGDAGIAVQLVLFDRCGLDTTGAGQTVRRWDDSPWNYLNNINNVIKADPAPQTNSGLPEFYRPDPTLRSIQEAYINYVVGRTRAWNVFYEIMNEPMWGSADERVNWADWVVGVIHRATGGQNLIFYNDHTPFPRGADVNRWKQLALPNYNNFHGVIFHGQGSPVIAPTQFNPDNSAYAFRAEKIFQVSTDGGPAGDRDLYTPNFNWCKYLFDHKMMYQAHTIASEAARAIGACVPTDLTPPEGPGGGGIGGGPV